MSDVQKPSIGRIVHYFDPDEKRAFAAIITDTIVEDANLTSDTHVGLHVFGGGSCDDDNFDDVPFSETRTKKAHWFWPPRV